jgi:drug/metabolite transporter (DMT)-like permease
MAFPSTGGVFPFSPSSDQASEGRAGSDRFRPIGISYGHDILEANALQTRPTGNHMNTSDPSPSVNHGRLCLITAAVLWSTSGAFTKLLTRDTGLGLEVPSIHPLMIAFCRVLVVACVFAPTLRRGQITFRPMMLCTMLAFAIMNASFVSAMALGTAANAIVLQYTAPTWLFLAGICFLGEKIDAVNVVTVVLSLSGIAVIVLGPFAAGESWVSGDLAVVGIALLSGISYAVVLLGLRIMRDMSSQWVTFVNHLASAFVLLPFVWTMPVPSWQQMIVLFFYGAGQMGLAYWLAARGLRSVGPMEAGAITLLEPLLNPVWAWLISGELPKTFELWGGLLILGALLARYAIMAVRAQLSLPGDGGA